MKNLSGSEKQVAWAEEIREGMVAMMREVEAYYRRYVEAERSGKNRAKRIERDEKSANIIAGAIANVESIDSAQWFIDNRNRVAETEASIRAKAEADGSEICEAGMKMHRSAMRDCTNGIVKMFS